MGDNQLKIENLWVSVEGKLILKGVSLKLKPGEVGVLMGPNGSGKTSLGLTLMGHPRYRVEQGKIELGKTNLLPLKLQERAKLGIFLSFQNPPPVPGVGVTNFLRQVVQKDDFSSFYQNLRGLAADLGLSEELLRRPLNEDFSGGEKKKMELLQVMVLRPKFIVFDEIDTGLDIDALRLIGLKINQLKKSRGILLVTHYQRILRWVTPDRILILKEGRIMAEGGPDLGAKIEKEGYGVVAD